MLVLDSIEQVGVSSLMVVNSLPSQVPVRKMGHESTAELNYLLVDACRPSGLVGKLHIC